LTDKEDNLETDQLKWLIDRSDRLRMAVATAAGTLISAITFLIGGVSFIINAAFDINNDFFKTTEFISTLRFFKAGLIVSLILMLIALFLAISAIASAHGFKMSFTPRQNKLNSIANVAYKMEKKPFPDLLQCHLKTAAYFQHRAQNQLKISLFMLILALLVPFLSLIGLVLEA
jgi:hypothetical protein